MSNVPMWLYKYALRVAKETGDHAFPLLVDAAYNMKTGQYDFCVGCIAHYEGNGAGQMRYTATVLDGDKDEA